MKKLASALLVFISILMATVAVAKPPVCVDQDFPPGKSKIKPSKVTILHCGCPDAGDMMYYVEIQVSSKSKGHAKHVTGSIDSCSDGSDNYRDFVRTASDCQVVADESELMDGWAACGDRLAGDECGMVGGDG
jgi:hypothetical protein